MEDIKIRKLLLQITSSPTCSLSNHGVGSRDEYSCFFSMHSSLLL